MAIPRTAPLTGWLGALVLALGCGAPSEPGVPANEASASVAAGAPTMDGSPAPAAEPTTEPEPTTAANGVGPGPRPEQTELDADLPAVIADDFDFDGHEDLAIYEGNSGPYGAPTYGIFVFRPGTGFVRSPELSELSEASISPVVIEAGPKLLRTASKSGCCIHWVAWHSVERGVPRLVRRETIDYGHTVPDACTKTIEARDGSGVMRKAFVACPPEDQP